MTKNDIAISVVSKVTGVSKKRIISTGQSWPLIEARMLVTLLLHEDGFTDMAIAFALKRKQPTVYNARQAAIRNRQASKVFKLKYKLAKDMYEEQKPLRIA